MDVSIDMSYQNFLVGMPEFAKGIIHEIVPFTLQFDLMDSFLLTLEVPTNPSKVTINFLNWTKPKFVV